MVAKKIAVIEQSDESPASVASPPDESPVKTASLPDEPDIQEETKGKPLADIRRPGLLQSEAVRPYESRSLDRLASSPRPLLKLASYTRNSGQSIKRRLRIAGLTGVALLLLIGGVYVLIKSTSSANPLPKSVQQKVDFTVYYPKSSTGEYKYLDGSSSYASGKLTYNLGSGGPLIHVSEQTLSVQPPNLHDLQNFSVFQAPAGEAAVGANGNVLNGVLIANKTLIILNGLGGVTMQDFIQTINNMQP